MQSLLKSINVDSNWQSDLPPDHLIMPDMVFHHGVTPDTIFLIFQTYKLIVMHHQRRLWVMHYRGLLLLYISVGDGKCERSFSESNSFVGSVVNRVESFKETHAKNEATRYWYTRIDPCTKFTNNQINFTGNTTDGNVKEARPDLSVRWEFEFNLIPKKKNAINMMMIPTLRSRYDYIWNQDTQIMQLLVLSRIDSEQTSGIILSSAGGFLVGFEGIVNHQNEASTYLLLLLLLLLLLTSFRYYYAPVSTMPGALDRRAVAPYFMDVLIPHHWLAGKTWVTGLLGLY